MYYDAQNYIDLANSMILDGKFSFDNFPPSIRGYLFPFVLLISNYISQSIFNNELVGIRILNSISITLIVYAILPTFFRKNISFKRKIIGSAVISVFILYFFGYLVYYPLSDIVSFLFFTSGVTLIKYINISIKKNVNFVKVIFLSFLTGIILYSAYNSRTIYLYPIILLLIIFWFINLRYNLKKTIILSILILTGMGIVALPQMKINKKYIGVYSPIISTPYQGAENLFLAQLYNGMSIQRYETYVGSLDQYPLPSVKFIDNSGFEILRRENMQINTISYLDIVKLFFKYPIDFIGIYLRHIVNYITPIFSQGYITDLNLDKKLLFILNFIIYAMCVLGVMSSYKGINLFSKHNLYFYILLLPVFLIIFGAPETRFFIQLYILIYVYLCYFIDIKNTYNFIKCNKVVIISLVIITFCLWICVIGNSLSSIEHSTLLF